MIIYVYTRIYTCMTIMPRLSGMFLLGEHDGVHKQEFWSSLTYCKISKDAWMICSTLCRVCMAQLWCSWSICVYRVALGLRTDRSNLVAMMEAMHIYIYIYIYILYLNLIHLLHMTLYWFIGNSWVWFWFSLAENLACSRHTLHYTTSWDNTWIALRHWILWAFIMLRRSRCSCNYWVLSVICTEVKRYAAMVVWEF